MRKRILFDIIIISLIGFLPILWLPGDTMLLGHDAGYPFDPITHFLDRFSVWSQRLGIGTDQSYGLLGALPIHGLQAFLVWIGLNFKTAQLLVFIFWLLLPGLSMYFFAYKMFRDKKYLPLFASLVYMINFYLLQAWFVAEQTKFTIYAALPIVAYFNLSFFLRKISLLKSFIGTGVTLGILNGGGSFPLYGGLIIYFGLASVYFNFINNSFQTLRRTIAYFIGTGVLYVLLSAYWLFPYIYYIFGFYTRDLALAGGAEGALAWATYLSKGTSFINLFRGQGVPDWYLNPFHAYASNYLSNPLLILASFIFPLLAYSSLLLVKDKKEKLFILFFVLLSLVTLIFAAGPGSQLAIIFEALTRYVPGFAIFRSAYHKFDYTFYLAYGILIGFTVNWLLTKIERKVNLIWINSQILVSALIIIFILGYLLYHFPFLTGSFLDYSNEPGKKLTNRITVPQYVYDFGEWSNKQDPTKRYLVVPELSPTGFVAFKWRYWSFAPVTSIQTSTSFVQNTFLIPQSERLFLRQMYSALLREDMKSFTDFTEVFAIDGIVVHGDFDWKNISWGTTDPAIYERILDNNPKFKLVQTFGKWKVYDITDRNKSLRITATPKLNFLQGELENVMSFPEFDPISPLFMADLDTQNVSYFANEATDIFVSPACIQCDLKQEYFGFRYYNPKVLPGSVLYPLILYRERKVKDQSKDFNSLLNHYLTTSDRRMVEAKWMVDSKEKVQFLQTAVDGYYSAIMELKDLVSKEWKVSGKEENKLARTIRGHLLQQVTLIDSIFEDELLNIEHRRVLSLAYDEILKIKEIADKKQWVTEDITDKRYIFDLPKTGSYDVYVKKLSLSDPARNASNSAIFFADSTVNITPISEIRDWLHFGNMNFDIRQVRLGFRDSTLANLLDTVRPEFPDGKQGIVQEDKKFSMNLDSRNKCFAYTANNLETLGTQYLVSFSYRNLTDKKDLGFYLSDIKQKVPKLRIRESFIPNSRAWANHYQVVTPAQNSIKLHFCNGFVSISQKNSVREREDLQFLSPGQNLIEIQDIGVYKISFPTIVLYQKQSDVEENEYVTDFQKTSTVEYKINVAETKGPMTLVMRESYGKYWQLCDEQKKCLSFNDKNHFNSAGFTNGWYFKDGIRGNIHLYYFPQKTYTIGAYLSIASLVIILGGILWRKLKKR